MAIGRTRRAAGFTLPLTMALAFSLMVVATALVGMVVVSDKQAKAVASAVVTRASLESAIEAGLFDLEQNGEPQAAEWTGAQTVNGQDVTLILADARYKPDVNNAPADQVGAALAEGDLRDRAPAAIAPPTPDGEAPPSFEANTPPSPSANSAEPPKPKRPAYAHFADFVVAANASPAEEDCLRRRLTIGREASMLPAPPASALTPPRLALGVGQVVDVRAQTRDWEGRWEVLWRRVRYTGRPERPWLTHDWRQLRLGRAEPDCPVVEVAPTISNAIHHGP